MGRKILALIEAIVSARILVFTVPVLINKMQDNSFSAGNIEHWFVLILSIVAMLYLTIGIATFAAVRMWSILHYVGLAITITLTLGLVNRLQESGLAISGGYLVPSIVSVVLAAIVLLFGKKLVAA